MKLYPVLQHWVADYEGDDYLVCLAIFDDKKKARAFLKKHIEKNLNTYLDTLEMELDEDEKEHILKQDVPISPLTNFSSERDLFEIYEYGYYNKNHVRIEIQEVEINKEYE